MSFLTLFGDDFCVLWLFVRFQSKEKIQSKNLTQNPPSSPTEPGVGYKSPPTLSAMSTTAVETTSAKASTAGKFTTANFIETTIQPSPANFGSISGAVTTIATSALSLPSTTPAGLSIVTSVTVSTESVARSPTTSSCGLKITTAQSSPTPSGSSGYMAKSSVTATATSTSAAAASPATFSNTFQNFVGQNYATQLDTGSSDLPTLSSPELPRGKKRQTKLALQLFVVLRFFGRNRSIASVFVYSHTLLCSVVCLSVCRLSRSCTLLNCSTDLDAIWQVSLWGPVHIEWGSLTSHGRRDLVLNPPPLSQNLQLPICDLPLGSTDQRFRVLLNYFSRCCWFGSSINQSTLIIVPFVMNSSEAFCSLNALMLLFGLPPGHSACEKGLQQLPRKLGKLGTSLIWINLGDIDQLHIDACVTV